MTRKQFNLARELTRLSKTMTQDELAKILGMEQPAVSKMLNGKLAMSDRTKIILGYYLQNSKK